MKNRWIINWEVEEIDIPMEAHAKVKTAAKANFTLSLNQVNHFSSSCFIFLHFQTLISIFDGSVVRYTKINETVTKYSEQEIWEQMKDIRKQFLRIDRWIMYVATSFEYGSKLIHLLPFHVTTMQWVSNVNWSLISLIIFVFPAHSSYSWELYYWLALFLSHIIWWKLRKFSNWRLHLFTVSENERWKGR